MIGFKDNINGRIDGLKHVHVGSVDGFGDIFGEGVVVGLVGLLLGCEVEEGSG